MQAGNELFQPRSTFDQRTLAQVLFAINEQVVGAQMRGKFGQQRRAHGFAVEPLLQHVETLYTSLPHDKEFAIDSSRQPQSID